MQGTQINNDPNKELSTAKVFSMPTLMEDKKLVVLVKYEVYKQEIITVNGFLWSFLTVGIMVEGSETELLNQIILHKRQAIATLMEEIKLAIVEKEVFE